MKKALSISIFEPVLVISDLLFAMGAFVAGLWLSGWYKNIGDDPQGTAGLIILGIIAVSFFPTFRLYSYHVLFSKKQHFTNLTKSFFWSALTLGIVLLLFNSSDLLRRNYYYFLIMLVLTALGVILLSRYFGAQIIDFLLSFGLAVFFVGVIGMVYQSGVPFFMTKEYMISGCFILAALLVACERYVLVHMVFNRWFRRHFRRQVLIIGSDNEAEQIVSHILENNSPYFVVGTIKASDSKSRYKLNNGKRELGGIDDLPRIIEEHNIDDIIITIREIVKPQLLTILDYCTTAHANAWLSPQLMPIIDIKLYIDRFCGFPMILLGSQKRSWLFDHLKLLSDKLIASLALLLLSPVLLLIAAAVKIDSPGPVFYKPEAIGLNGTLFKMFKFRSMQMDSDNAIHKEYVAKLINGEIEKESVGDKPLKITDDPRVTTVGCFIRKSSLDELPQLFNVLQGNMSLVGPRPCLPYEFAMYKEWQKKRTIVQPGITGLWQITGRSEVVFEDMILLDFYYIFNRNIMLDFNIIFETIFVVLGRKGGY